MNFCEETAMTCRILGAAFAWTLFACHTVLAQFPEVDQLPVRKELPDPLVMLGGQRVASQEDWFNKRRPELKELFQYYMYGYAPPAPKEIRTKTERVESKYFGGKATKKEVTIAFDPPGSPQIHLLLVAPNNRQAPAPVFVGLNFCGNHQLVDDPSVALPEAWARSTCPGCTKDGVSTDAGRGKQIDTWSLEQSIDRGYAVATFYYGDIDPDKNDMTDGVHPCFLKPGQKELGPHDWGAIAAWAWGVSRAVDYLVTDPDLDAKKIAVMGHSRLGKTALLAAALDERIALAIPHQAGCGGTAPSRSATGESVERINTSFPHWFNDTFPLFNKQVERLPFDQHCLVALVAPRPVLYTNAVEDTWANPAGQFEMLKAANPVYELLGCEGLTAKEMPPNETLVSSTLGYYIRPGKHSTTPGDWKIFLDFADKHFKK